MSIDVVSSNKNNDELVKKLQSDLAKLIDEFVANPRLDWWLESLVCWAKNPHYSFNNILLIERSQQLAGLPVGERVGSFNFWKSVGHSVIKGQKSIRIIAPVVKRVPEPVNKEESDASSVDGSLTREDGKVRFVNKIFGFRPMPVFSMSQTTGPEINLGWSAVELAEQPIADKVWGSLIDFAAAHGFKVEFAPNQIDLYGITNFSDKTIRIDSGLSKEHQLHTLAHELGHMLLHDPEKLDTKIGADLEEIEAESVGFIVAAAHGLKVDKMALPYLTDHHVSLIFSDKETLEKSSKRIHSAAKTLLDVSLPKPVDVVEKYQTPQQKRSAVKTSKQTETATALASPPPSTTAANPELGLTR